MGLQALLQKLALHPQFDLLSRARVEQLLGRGELGLHHKGFGIAGISGVLRMKVPHQRYRRHELTAWVC
ncbi:hypothetical protein D3C71_2058990 [compost metagenome]